MTQYTGFGGFIVLVLAVWAIVSIVGSNSGTGKKVLWILLVVFLPILGFIFWLIAGPRAASGRG
ncbi:PLD nuclease N-terminal domain-containing protein [Roseovarius aestuarii]|nr:PLD nuclease N-terminal domain-containing protein [Roseovarius aestuarii]